MPFVDFHKFFPDLAERETRFATLPEGDEELPADTYAMVEMYCDEPGCDCRRVFFNVVSKRLRKPLAVVAYGWESRGFYARWLKGAPVDPDVLRGPILDIGSPQSRYAPMLLRLIDDVLLADPAYIERLKRHYQMVRDAVDRKTPQVSAPVGWRRNTAERKRVLAAKMREVQARRSQKKRRAG
jgi:hypothetical protein